MNWEGNSPWFVLTALDSGGLVDHACLSMLDSHDLCSAFLSWPVLGHETL